MDFWLSVREISPARVRNDACMPAIATSRAAFLADLRYWV